MFIVSLALVCLAMAGAAWGQACSTQNNNGVNRQYAVTISPSEVPANTSTQFTLYVTNDLGTEQKDAIGEIWVTVPTGFTIQSVTPPPLWFVFNITGQVIDLQQPANGSGIPVGASVPITVTAITPNQTGGGTCGLPSSWPSYAWNLVVSQGVNGGGGNQFCNVGLPASVTVPPGN